MGMITIKEAEMASELLKSENVREIMDFMTAKYAAESATNCNHLLQRIPDIAAANIKRQESELFLRQKAVETIEFMLPSKAEWEFGPTGAVMFVYCQCNFRKMWIESRQPELHKNMLTALQAMQGHPGIRATLPQFKKYVDECRENPGGWEDSLMWDQIDNEDCKEMVRWCIANKQLWDDMDDYMQKIEAFKLNTPKRGRPAKEQ